MGIRLAATALIVPIKEPSPLWQARARLVLVTMALHAKDDDPHPWYSGGRTFLAETLHTLRLADITRAQTILAANGLIERTYTSSRGRPLSGDKPARWLIHLR
jgi:hypothetical protein